MTVLETLRLIEDALNDGRIVYDDISESFPTSTTGDVEIRIVVRLKKKPTNNLRDVGALIMEVARMNAAESLKVAAGVK